MAKGKIVDWKADRGFGFIRPRDGGGDVFLHIGDLRHVRYEPRIGDDVSYSVKRDARGRPRAARAVVAGIPRTRRDWAGFFTVLMPVLFLAGLYVTEDYRPVLLGYLGMSLVAFVAYAVDKRRAKSGGWRISEATLHWIGFLGGWPGAIPAQLLFRHKTRKPSFQIVFWMIVIGHMAFWAWLSMKGLSPGDLIGHVLEIADSLKGR